MQPDSTESTPFRSSNTASRHQKQPPARVAISLPASVMSFSLFLRLACYFVGSRPTTLQYAEFGLRPSPARTVPTLGGIEHESLTKPARRHPRRPQIGRAHV